MKKLRFPALRQEQGLTLIELLVVVVIMVGVFSAILAMLDSVYASYGKVTDNSQNQRTALMIEQDVTSDLRQAALSANGTFQINLPTLNYVTITKTNNQTVTYDGSGGQVQYQSASGAGWINLTTNGSLQVTDSSTDSALYTVTVKVGSGASEAQVSTTVAPYDWGK